jgi:V/A-type H+-transporting ATPase subunit K
MEVTKMAVEGAAPAVGEVLTSMAPGLIAVGAGLAVGLSAIGAGLAEGEIGAAAVGAITEDEKMFGKALIFTVIPETLVIFGLVVAIMLLGYIRV